MEKEDLFKIIDHFGVKAQTKKFNEECFEVEELLIKEQQINTLKGYSKIKKDLEEEIADVIVMLAQFIIYYNLDKKNIEEIENYKVDRTLGRINEIHRQN